MDVEQFRKAGHQAIDHICDYFYSLKDKPVIPPVRPGYLRPHIPLNPPEKGEGFQDIADDFQKLIVPGLTLWQHPSFFGYFPAACTFEGILGDLYSSSVTNPGFNWLSSPACTELESIVVDWAANLLGLNRIFTNASGIGGGVIQTTASDSVLTAVVAARSLYKRNNPDVDLENLVIYMTTQTHSLGAKAGLILGIKVRALEVRFEDQLSLRGATLRNALEEDICSGIHPFIMIATVGTTSTGANDNMREIRQVVEDYPSLWVHVDAAWAGVALACHELREQLYLDDINTFAKSFCTNFHKWGLVNFDCSTFWVRDRKNLTDALDTTPPFLRTKEGDSGTVIDYRNWHLSLGRRFRSLKLWFVLRSFGVDAFQNHIRHGIGLNDLFVKLIQNSKDLALVVKPSLSLSVFRLVPELDQAKYQLDELNDLNRLYYSQLSARRDIVMTQTNVNNIFCIRMAIGGQRTTEKHIKNAYDILEMEAKATLDLWKNSMVSIQTVHSRKCRACQWVGPSL